MTRTRTPELFVTDNAAEAGVRKLLEIDPRTIALAGGSTPRRMYERWARTDFPWPDVHIYFGDERCVPAGDAASNFHMAEESLLSKVPVNVHRMPGDSCAPEAYEVELRSTFADGGPTFDLVMLGLGEDGHTASLFPGDPALEVTERWVVGVERPDFNRLTLTLPVLSAARVAMFLVTGAPKRTALRQLLDGDDIPAARVSAERVIVIADRAAVPLGDRARAWMA